MVLVALHLHFCGQHIKLETWDCFTFSGKFKALSSVQQVVQFQTMIPVVAKTGNSVYYQLIFLLLDYFGEDWFMFFIVLQVKRKEKNCWRWVLYKLWGRLHLHYLTYSLCYILVSFKQGMLDLKRFHANKCFFSWEIYY